MSAIGTKRTSLVALHMSAFGGKADMPFCTAHVRLRMSAYDPKRTCVRCRRYWTNYKVLLPLRAIYLTQKLSD